MDTNRRKWSFEKLAGFIRQVHNNLSAQAGPTVNISLMFRNWLMGREIIQKIQAGDKMAEYGKQLIEQLFTKLNHKYNRGFSATNLRYFRTFYTVYSNRIPEIRHIACGEFKSSGKRHTQSGVLEAIALAVEQAGIEHGFSPNLDWSHYRFLMKVEHKNERLLN